MIRNVYPTATEVVTWMRSMCAPPEDAAEHFCIPIETARKYHQWGLTLEAKGAVDGEVVPWREHAGGVLPPPVEAQLVAPLELLAGTGLRNALLVLVNPLIYKTPAQVRAACLVVTTMCSEWPRLKELINQDEIEARVSDEELEILNRLTGQDFSRKAKTNG